MAGSVREGLTLLMAAAATHTVKPHKVGGENCAHSDPQPCLSGGLHLAYGCSKIQVSAFGSNLPCKRAKAVLTFSQLLQQQCRSERAHGGRMCTFTFKTSGAEITSVTQRFHISGAAGQARCLQERAAFCNKLLGHKKPYGWHSSVHTSHIGHRATMCIGEADTPPHVPLALLETILPARWKT